MIERLVCAPCPASAAPRFVAVVSRLIVGAVATFDADPDTSRAYLIRASVILQACASVESETVDNTLRRGGLAQWKLRRVVDYIEEHFAERIAADDLAAQIDVSVGQLFRAFKASLGISPLQYVGSRRLQFACGLMRTTQLPLSQIAVNAGFCDQSHLCRAFRRATGLTPAAWRRENAVAPPDDSLRCVRPVARKIGEGSPINAVTGTGEWAR